MWDESKISVVEVLNGEYSLIVKCVTVCKKVCWITNVYGPTDYREKWLVWIELASLADYCLQPCILGGGGGDQKPSSKSRY